MKPDQYKQEASRRHQAKLKRGGGLGTSLSSSRKQLVDQKSRRAGRKVVGDNSWRFDNSYEEDDESESRTTERLVQLLQISNSHPIENTQYRFEEEQNWGDNDLADFNKFNIDPMKIGFVLASIPLSVRIEISDEYDINNDEMVSIPPLCIPIDSQEDQAKKSPPVLIRQTQVKTKSSSTVDKIPVKHSEKNKTTSFNPQFKDKSSPMVEKTSIKQLDKKDIASFSRKSEIKEKNESKRTIETKSKSVDKISLEDDLDKLLEIDSKKQNVKITASKALPEKSNEDWLDDLLN